MLRRSITLGTLGILGAIASSVIPLGVTHRAAIADSAAAPPPRGLPEALRAGLGENEAVAWALRENPSLRALRLGRAVAAGEIQSATTLQEPSVRLELQHAQETDPSRRGFAVGLQWTPPQPFLWIARRARAQALVSEVGSEIAEQEWVLACAVRAAHRTLLELEQQRRLQEEAVALRQRMVSLLRERMKLGDATRLEVNLGELAVLQAKRELDQGALRRAEAQSQLRALLGVLTSEDVPLRGTPPGPEQDPAPVPDAAVLIDRALANSPSLRTADAKVKGREEALRVEKAGRWPWLQLRGRYRHNELAGYPRDVELGVDITVPVLNRNAGPIQVAEAAQRRELAQRAAVAQAQAQRVYAACAELRVHRAALARLREESMPVLVEHERIMAAAAQGAQVDLVALLSSEESVLRGKREMSEARLAYLRAALALEAALGPGMTGHGK